MFSLPVILQWIQVLPRILEAGKAAVDEFKALFAKHGIDADALLDQAIADTPVQKAKIADELATLPVDPEEV